jgi:hypothetical protein
MPVGLKVAKAPSWALKGINVSPYLDTAITRTREEMVSRHDKSRGLGARVNRLSVGTQPLLQTITTPLALPTQSIRENPRRTGSNFLKKNIGRFKGMAPRVLKKYVLEPVKALWAS